jgi:hypothetical protein
MTRPHEDLYDELLEWALSKEGINEPADITEAIGQMFAAALSSYDTPDPVALFRSKIPAMEALILQMWAQSAEGKN